MTIFVPCLVASTCTECAMMLGLKVWAAGPMHIQMSVRACGPGVLGAVRMLHIIWPQQRDEGTAHSGAGAEPAQLRNLGEDVADVVEAAALCAVSQASAARVQLLVESRAQLRASVQLHVAIDDERPHLLFTKQPWRRRWTSWHFGRVDRGLD